MQVIELAPAENSRNIDQKIAGTFLLGVVVCVSMVAEKFCRYVGSPGLGSSGKMPKLHTDSYNPGEKLR